MKVTEKNVFEEIKKIEMPDDMKQRIIKRCEIETGEQNMSKKNVMKFTGRPMATAAALVLCLCLTGVTVLAATGKLEGFFKDVKRWNGVVIGTIYEQATDEIKINIIEVTDELTVEISMVDLNAVPYSTFELFGVAEYKIVDMDGKKILEVDEAVMAEISSGKAVIHIPAKEVPEGEYRLIISEMMGSAKADQPLVLKGKWESSFEK